MYGGDRLNTNEDDLNFEPPTRRSARTQPEMYNRRTSEEPEMDFGGRKKYSTGEEDEYLAFPRKKISDPEQSYKSDRFSGRYNIIIVVVVVVVVV